MAASTHVRFPLLFLLLLLLPAARAPPPSPRFPRGFKPSDLYLSVNATVTSSGLLQLTDTTRQAIGHAFFPTPFNLKANTTSFSSRFVFGIIPKSEDSVGHGLTFALAPSKDLPGSVAGWNLGLFSDSNVGNVSDRIVAVEFDTSKNSLFKDIDDNHVGVDVGGLKSRNAESASYVDGGGQNRSIDLKSGMPIQALVEYDAGKKRMTVTIWPASEPQPGVPLVVAQGLDLATLLADETYVGFTASNGDSSGGHYVLGWTMSLDGPAPELDLAHLPRLPVHRKKISTMLVVLAALCAALAAALGAVAGAMWWKWRGRFAEVVEDWEEQYGPHRIGFRNLHRATGGFREENVVGFGGFGKVYHGVMPSTAVEVAVKRVAHGSQQGMREFVAEIASMGRLRHRNLVQLLGYCRRDGELILVYEYMPNGSLDRLLHGVGAYPQLSWSQRVRVIRGVAAGLSYLHHGWEQVVVHRDVKAANVLLDGELNGRLSDFGLARLHDHGANLQTTRLVGTLGYLAPELVKTGKATTSSDVFAFGTFLLEVACGRRPVEVGQEDRHLLDWVLECWRSGAILEAADPRLAGRFASEEMEMILQLGLLCSHPEATERPTMQQVSSYLDFESPLPSLLTPRGSLHVRSVAFRQRKGSEDFSMSTYSSTAAFTTTGLSVAGCSDVSTSPFRSGDDEILLRRVGR